MRKQAAKLDLVSDPAKRDGEVRKALNQMGFMDDLILGNITQSQVAKETPYAQSSIGQAVEAEKERRQRAEDLENWDEPWEQSPEWKLENLDELVDHFKTFRIKNFKTPNGNPYELPWHQERWIKAIIRTMITGSKLMILSPPRHGKLLADSTPVLTTDGWRTHGDLRVGDSVYAPDGFPTEVTHVFPKDVASMEVEFSDGEVFKAHPDHLWRVYDRSGDEWRTMETKELLAEGLHCGTTKSGNPRNRYMVEYCEPIQNEEVDLPIDPYFLGVWLGDGKSEGLQICGSPDDLAEIEVELKDRGYVASWETTHATTGVRYLGFKTGAVAQGSRSYWTNLFNNKHVPDIYHTASEEQRRDLLRGLVDSDGHVSEKTGRVRFVNCDEQLIEDVVKLVASLGYRPSVTSQEPQLSSSGIQGRQVVYTVQWTPSDGERQAYLARKDIRHEGLRRRRSIVDIREAENPEPGNCIRVDHPSHQYLVGHKLTPTHNTDLLAHFDIWLVACINPNVRIITIGGSEDVSENSSGLARAELENNETLIESYCPPGTRFQPPRGGPSWTSSDWTVNTRFIQSKSPTMKAIGRNGTILSRDADVIIADDIEDHKSTWTDTNREKTRQWWGNDVDSRETGATSVIYIGSRQHPDDLMSYIIEDKSWRHIIETIHDDEKCPVMEEIGEEEAWHCDCELRAINEQGMEGHDPDCHFRQHTAQEDGGCMLWPDGPAGDERDFHFASTKKNNPHVNFAMTWQNEPQDSDITVFSRDLIRSCHDHRDTGDVPKMTRLIAGLDPSGSQYQAAFLWGFNPEENRRYAIDFDNQLGGGIKRAREQIKEWFTEYGVRWWVIEENLYHGGIVEDELLRQFTQREGIRLEPHRTGTNKWDPEMGVSSLATWMEQGLLKIPNGSNKTAAKWREYERQLRNFSRETARSRKSRSDIVMASWFPEKRMKSWRREFMEGMRDQGTNLPSSYPFEDAGLVYDRMFS